MELEPSNLWGLDIAHGYYSSILLSIVHWHCWMFTGTIHRYCLLINLLRFSVPVTAPSGGKPSSWWASCGNLVTEREACGPTCWVLPTAHMPARVDTCHFLATSGSCAWFFCSLYLVIPVLCDILVFGTSILEVLWSFGYCDFLILVPEEIPFLLNAVSFFCLCVAALGVVYVLGASFKEIILLLLWFWLRFRKGFLHLLFLVTIIRREIGFGATLWFLSDSFVLSNGSRIYENYFNICRRICQVLPI